MAPPFLIRLAAEADAPALQALYRQCRSEADWLPPLARQRAAEADFAADSAGELVLVAVAVVWAAPLPCKTKSRDQYTAKQRLYTAVVQKMKSFYKLKIFSL